MDNSKILYSHMGQDFEYQEGNMLPCYREDNIQVKQIAQMIYARGQWIKTGFTNSVLEYHMTCQ